MVLDSSLKVCFVMLENFHSACRKQPGPLRFLLSDIKRCISLLLPTFLYSDNIKTQLIFFRADKTDRAARFV